MGIGLSGMISGLDTDAIVQAMVSAQRTKSTKIENKITLNKWTTEAWSGLNTKIYSFYTKYASKLRLQSSYMTRTAKSSNESVVTATAGSTAAVGTHSLQIKSLASSQYVTGGQLKDKTNPAKKASYNKNTKLTEMGDGVKAGTIITITGKKGTDDEVVKKLEVTDKTTVNDLLNACKDAGLTASFDETQQRFFISSSQSGADDAFSITTSELSGTASTVFNEINEAIKTEALSAEEKTKYNEAMATLRQNVGTIKTVLSADYDESDKTQKAVYEAINVVKDAAEKTAAYETATSEKKVEIDGILQQAATDSQADATAKFTIYEKEYTYADLKNTVEEKLEKALAESSDKTADEAVKALNIDLSDTTKYVDASTLNAAKVTEAQEKIDKYNEEAEKVANGDADALTEDELKALEEEAAKAQKVVDTWNYAVEKDANGVPTKTLGQVYTEAYNTAYGTGVTEDAVTKEIYNTVIAENKSKYDAEVSARSAEILAAEDTEAVKQLKSDIEASLTSASTSGATASTSGLSALGLGEIDGSSVSDGGANGMAVVAASNAEFVLDGATMTETSNNFTVNGITLNLSATTESKDTPGTYESVQITVGKDGDATYDLIKEALTEYNKLIEEMNKLYNADSARGYDPLTDEQKEAMTEDDIKNWEDKIKGSLLRRDDSLGSLLNSMRSALSSTYTDEDDGKTYSLSTFGIVTGNYTEKGKLHIYGDEDDPTYATYTDRLKTALEDDPDQVMEVLTNVFGKLYDTMTEKCAKTEISSALTFYNDKQYKNLLDDYEDDLDIMEDRIKALEDKYYKQFTAMETALSKLQSQTNSLASLLGSSTQ